MTIERIIEIAEELHWTVKLSEQDNRKGGIDKIASFYKSSPAGEDFGFDIFYTDADDLVHEIDEYYEDFDIDEHIEMWIEARSNGVTGVPSTRELVKDAEDIDKMLEILSDKMHEEETKDYEEYLEAVDIVCIGCAYGEETCDTCPVCQTVKKMTLNKIADEVFEEETK